MPLFQNGANVLVALKRETTTGVAPSAGGGTQLRVTSSPGLVRKRATIQSQEKRSDMLKTFERLGGVTVDGSYNAELTVGGATDILLEAIMRSTWSAALVVTTASHTSITTTTSTIVALAGSWLTDGIKVGDVLFLTGTATAANNGINLRVVSVTATTITVAGTPLTLNATADATGNVTRLKKLVNGPTAVRYTHAIEQYNIDVDLSELFLGCRIIGVKLMFKPGQMATLQYTFLGLDRQALTTGTSPFFTSPTLTTGLDLIADDSAIRFNGANVANFTGFELNFGITAKAEPVIGTFISPDVFDNDMDVSGSVSALRSDFSNLTLFDAETEFEVSIMLQEPTGTPKACLNFYIPRCKIGGLSAPVAGDGAMVETLPLLIGPRVAATGFDSGMANISSSAP